MDPAIGSADVLPQGIGVDQRSVRRHRQTRARHAARLRGGDRAGDRTRDPGRHHHFRREPRRLHRRARRHQRRVRARYPASADPVLRGQVLPDVHARSGPELVLLDADELKRFGDLRLRLSVNGDERQNALVDGDMLYRPLQALQSLTQFQELAAGRPGAHRHPGRHRAERAAEADRRSSATCCRRPSSGRRSSSVRPATRSTCRTATSSRRRWPPTTGPSTSEPSAPQCDSRDA